MRDVIRDDFAFAATQYTGMLERIKNDPKLPHSFADGKMTMTAPEGWTSGFFPGSLWFIYEYTRGAKWKAAAEDYTGRLERIQNFTGNHDVGFMLYCSYGTGLRLTENKAYRAILLQGAKSLCSRYSPAVGLIKSWDNKKWQYPVIVDNMMNLELLMWAARESGDQRFKEISFSHADKTLANHFRPDGSSFHLVDYDPATGKVLSKQTVQGAADPSAWARGQSWGLYGYTLMFRETRNPAYLAQAKAIANFILNHPRLPADKIPYWDFDASGIPNEPRDASSGAIIASALIELSGYVEPALAQQYLSVAEQQLRSLSSPAYRAKVGENGNFLLMHSVTSKPVNREVDQPLSYADYYFLEALLRFQAKLPATAK